MSSINPNDILVVIEPSGVIANRGLIQVRIDYFHEGCDPHGHFRYLHPNVSDEEIISWALEQRELVAAAWSAGVAPNIVNKPVTRRENLTEAEQAALEARVEQIKLIQISAS